MPLTPLEKELLTKLAALPAPDFLHDNKLSDPIGSGASYRADTVVRLIDEAVKAERERLAAYIDRLVCPCCHKEHEVEFAHYLAGEIREA